MDLTLLALIAVASAITLLLWFKNERQQRKNSHLREENGRLKATLESERGHFEDRLKLARNETRTRQTR